MDETVANTSIANLSFEQQRELLFLQMERGKLKHCCEQDRMDLEKAKVELELFKLNLVKKQCRKGELYYTLEL